MKELIERKIPYQGNGDIELIKSALHEIANGKPACSSFAKYDLSIEHAKDTKILPKSWTQKQWHNWLLTGEIPIYQAEKRSTFRQGAPTRKEIKVFLKNFDWTGYDGEITACMMQRILQAIVLPNSRLRFLGKCDAKTIACYKTGTITNMRTTTAKNIIKWIRKTFDSQHNLSKTKNILNEKDTK